MKLKQKIGKERGKRRNLNQHIEDADRAKSTRIPLFLVGFHGWRHGVCKFTDDGDCPLVTGKMALLVAIDGLLKDKKSKDDCDGGKEPCCRLAVCNRGNGEGVERGIGGGGWYFGRSKAIHGEEKQEVTKISPTEQRIVSSFLFFGHFSGRSYHYPDVQHHMTAPICLSQSNDSCHIIPLMLPLRQSFPRLKRVYSQSSFEAKYAQKLRKRAQE